MIKKKELSKKEKNTFLIKATIHALALLEEMDNAGVDSEESIQLKTLLEQHTEMAFQQPILQSTSFIQNLENKFETAIRKTAQEFNIKL